MTYPIDARAPATVWRFVNEALEEMDFPSVSWALGSDWGSGTSVLTATEYRDEVKTRMTQMYGADPS